MADYKAHLTFPETFTAQDMEEMPSRGYVSHVVVTLEDGREFEVFFIDPVRLQQTVKDEVVWGRPYYSEAGMIVLPEVTVELMQVAVEALAQQNFFEHLKPINK